MNDELPEVSFTPEGRDLEYFIFQEYKKGIFNSKEISKESKLMQIKLYEDYLKVYEECYKDYQERERKLLDKIKKSWKEAEQSLDLSSSWGKFLLKKSPNPLEILN